MPAVPEELDVFRLAHGHMKQLVKDMDKEVSINFNREKDLFVNKNLTPICFLDTFSGCFDYIRKERTILSL